MLLKVPCPVLSMVESYLGSKDKFNLRLTCKLLSSILSQWELPYFRSHYVPTRTLQASFISAVGEVLPSPLFPERFGATKLVEKATILRSSHSIARACMKCNHNLPHTAITLPTLVHHGVDAPILKMQSDHRCFHDLPITYESKEQMESVYPQDAVFAVNLLQFNSPTEYTSTVFLCCSHGCFRDLAIKMCGSPTPVAVIGQEVTFVQKLDASRIAVELRYFTFFSKHLSLLVEYSSTNMVVRSFRFRMENFHYRAPGGGAYTSLDFSTFAEVLPAVGMDCAQSWLRTCDSITSSGPAHMLLKTMAQKGQRTEEALLQWFPEHSLTPEEFSSFLELFHFPFTTSPHPYLYVEEGEEGGDLLLFEMTYSFSAIIYNDGLDWVMEGFVHNFEFPAHQNRALLRNLRTNLQTAYEQTALQRGMVGVHGTLERLRFDFFVLSCDENSIVSASSYEYDDLIDDDEETETETSESESEVDSEETETEPEPEDEDEIMTEAVV